MPQHANAGKTVAQILIAKRAAIKNAPLEPGAPSWDDVHDMLWEEIELRASRRELGFRTFKKLLEQKRFNKP